MTPPKFILSKKKLLDQVKTLEDLGLKISYSYKTNREVGNLLQEISDVDFSIHAFEEIEMIKNKFKIWFFTQAESEKEFEEILEKDVKNFVVDNEVDLKNLMKVVEEKIIKINLSLRMKFQEHRIGTGKYFVYGIDCARVNDLIKKLRENSFIDKLGIHIHRKSQNINEWEIKSELEDSIGGILDKLDFVNLGGGLPSYYKSFNPKVFDYIFEKLKKVSKYLENFNIQTYIEPGRFLAAPCIKLETKIMQIQGKNIILNTTIYNCALDTHFTGTKMLVEGELEKGQSYLIKGNSPTRDDIFRYNVKLENLKVGDKIVFLNAGAYNYTTDFFGYKKLKTEIVEDFE